MAKYQGRKGELRVYDGTGTPNYFTLAFAAMDFTGPDGRPRPDEELQLDRETATTNAHYTRGSDAKVMDPVEISFSGALDSSINKDNFIDALRCAIAGWATTKGSTSITNGEGASVTTPAFADASKKTVDIEVLWDSDSDKGKQYAEVYFPPESIQIQEAAGDVMISATGQCYGAIADITAFTAGSAV